MPIQNSSTVVVVFSTGINVAADTLPTLQQYVNGEAVGHAGTVAAVAGKTGVYTASDQISGAVGDVVQFVVDYALSAVRKIQVIFTDTITEPVLQGPHSVTLNFLDVSLTPVPHARFSVVGYGHAEADENGQAVIGMPNGTFQIVTWADGGVLFTNQSFTVDGDTEADIIASDTITEPGPGPGQTSALLITYDEHGDVKSDVVVYFALVEGPGDAGNSFSTKEFTATSDTNGLLTVLLVKGALYRAKREAGKWIKFRAASTSNSSLPEILGRPMLA